MVISRLPGRRADPQGPVTIERLEAALAKVAVLVAEDVAFAPIFERLEAELALARRQESRLSEVQRRARRLLDHKAMPRTNSARCDSDAPRP